MFLRRFQYDAWANQRFLALLQSVAPALPAAELLYAHIHQAQRIWLWRILGNEKVYQLERFPQMTLAEAVTLRDEITAPLHDIAQEYSRKPDPTRVIHFHDLQGNPQADHLEDILDQLFTHGAYHRAQIAVLLRQAGHTPPNTDYIAFCRQLK